MAQLVRAPTSDAYGGKFTSRPGHIHTKGFNMKLIICLWYKISKLLQETSNSSLLFSKPKDGLK